MTVTKRHGFLGVFGVLAFVMVASPSFAAPKNTFGARLGVYTDIEELFLGVEGLAPLTSTQLYFNPNVEFILIDNGTFVTFNFDFHYDLPTQNRGLFFWTGGGLGLLYFNPEGPFGNDTDLGLNLLFGIGFNQANLVPYIQSKFIISDNTELSIGFGVRF